MALVVLFVVSFASALSLSPTVRSLSYDGLAEMRWLHWLGVILWAGSFYTLRRETLRHLPRHDVWLIPLATLLTGWGLLSIWRLTTLFGLRQSVWVTVCSAIIIFLLRRKDQLLNTLRNYKYIWLFSGFLITALTFFFGTNPSGIGPRLWLGCCGIFFQPSEPLKLLLIIYLAAYLADKKPLMRGLLPLLAPTFIMTGMALLLLLIQRDLGAAWIFILIYMVMIYFATGLRRILIISLFSIALAMLLGNELVPLINLRIEVWLNPWLDSSAGGYQIVQGLLAVAAGGLFGRGPGLGSPGLVPVAHSDFIYTSIVEETGLLGAIALLTLVSFLVMRALRISLQAKNAFQAYLALGLSAYLASQSLLIIAGNIRLLPLTGVTLPFVSYGGSSLLTSLFALLLLAIISHESEGGKPSALHANASKTIASFYLSAFALAALVTGWWGLVRAPDLLSRPDNARRAFSERLVKRGSLLDRYDEPLNISEGEAGSLMRTYLQPELSSVLGYSSAIYGHTGIELGLDSILSGEESQDASGTLFNQLLYAQNPPGPNIRLSLDLALQLEASSLLDYERGAAVLLNSDTGEILVLASSPTFDANQIDENWEEISRAEGSPFLNRALQGAYPPGTALAPLIYTAGRMQAIPLPELADLSYTADELTLSCLRQPQEPLSWEVALAAACPGPVADLGVAFGDEALLALFNDVGFYNAPAVRVESFSTEVPTNISRPGLAAIGQSDLLLSPLQMALAASTLSNSGVFPAPQLALALQEISGGWLDLPPLADPQLALNASLASASAQTLASETLPIWQHTGRGYGNDDQVVIWYLAGTLPGQAPEGGSLTIAILLEKDEAALARAIGQRLLLAALDN
jgi:cell division protein FtsW (lipid II flippase)